MTGRDSARRHWIALDEVFSRTLAPADLARARQEFGEHADAVSDVCFQLLDDLPAELRATVALMKATLRSAWSEQPEAFQISPPSERPTQG